jgi:hypothetical protein
MTTAGIWANCPSDERWGSAAPTPMQAQNLELSARMGAEREYYCKGLAQPPPSRAAARACRTMKPALMLISLDTVSLYSCCNSKLLLNAAHVANT